MKRMRERPTRRLGDRQRINAGNKNDADEDEAMRRYLSRVESLMTNHYYAKVQTTIARCVETPNETEISHGQGR